MNRILQNCIKGLTAAMLITGLSACSSAPAGSSAAASSAGSQKESVLPEEITTMGQALKVEADSTTLTITEDQMIYMFETDGNITRVYADLTKELYDKIEAIPMDDMDREEKLYELVADLKITRKEDLTDSVPTPEELSALKGKKGQELLDQGFTVQGIAVDENNQTTFVIDNGVYQLEVKVEEENKLPDQPDAESIFSECTVKEAVFITLIGNGTEAAK